jgi:hypothetical protein
MSGLDLELRGSLWSAALSIFTSSSTLVCCAIPALLVTLGAGATLAGLVSAVPQLVWLSANKLPLFALAAAMLVLAGAMQYRARHAPCPADPRLAAACTRTRRIGLRIYLLSVAIYLVGAAFAFLLPLLGQGLG